MPDRAVAHGSPYQAQSAPFDGATTYRVSHWPLDRSLCCQTSDCVTYSRGKQLLEDLHSLFH